MKKIILSLFILNYSVDGSQLSTPYNEHAILMTHNSTSIKNQDKNYQDNNFIKLLISSLKDADLVADQNLPVIQQLKDGARGFKIPLHQRSDGQIYICHTLTKDQIKSKLDAIPHELKQIMHDQLTKLENEPCIIDKTYQRFRIFLNEINTFLEANPNEIVTLYLDTFALENANPAIQSKIRAAFAESGIADKIYFDAGHNTGKPWPTLSEMVNDKKKRLVIFAGHPHWEDLGVFDHNKIVFRTKYEYKNPTDLQDDSNSPNISDGTVGKNKLFMIDNYTTPLIAGSASDAAVVNSYSSLKRRFCQYQKLAGGIKPSILMVDFYQLPNNDPIRFINDWNAGKIDCSK
jgi:hypothetical protein